MRRKIKTAVSCIVTVCLTICFLSNLTNLMERKSSKVKYMDFLNKRKILMCCLWGQAMLSMGSFQWNCGVTTELYLIILEVMVI